MKVAALCLGRRFDDPKTQTERLLPLFDLVVFARPVATADVDQARSRPDLQGRFDPLSRLSREGAPVLVLELPPRPHEGSLTMILSNLERFFPLDAVLLLHGHELVRGCDRRSLESYAQSLRPGRWGYVALHAFPRSSPEARFLRLGWRPATAKRWRRIMRRAADGIPRTFETLAPLEIETANGPEDRFLNFEPRATEAEPSDGAVLPEDIPPPSLETAGATGANGVWRADFHRSNFYLDVPPFRYLANRLRPDSVLDLGCGLGGYVALLRGWGAHDVLGVDGFEPPEPSDELACPLSDYRQHDLRQPLDLKRTYDLVMCTEVAEHLDAEHESVLLDSLARHARGCILFSAARPGQPGVGHVNCRPGEHWAEAWRRRGFQLHDFDTRVMRSLSTFYWFRRNLMVLVPESEREDPEPFVGAPEPGDIEIRTTAWRNQTPRICRHVFTEALPEIYRKGLLDGMLKRLLRL